MKRIIQALLGKIGYRLVPVKYLGDLCRDAHQRRIDNAYYQATINNLTGYKDAYEELSRDGDDGIELAAYRNALDQALRDLGAYRAEFDRLKQELEAAKEERTQPKTRSRRRPVASR